MFHCPCKYCRDPRSKFNALRRRNPDDLERLEKIVEARKLYKETGSIRQAVVGTNTNFYTVTEWLKGLGTVEKPKDPRYEEVRRVFLETQNYSETARRTGVHKRTVRKWVADLVSSPVGRYSQTQKERVLKLCKDLDLSYTEMSRLSGVSRTIVSKICRDANIRKKQLKSEREGRIIPGLQEAKLLHQQGVRMPEIARRLSIKPVTVRSWKRKGWLRRRNPDDLETLEKIAKARRLYQEGVSFREIARRIDVSGHTVRRWVADLIETWVDPRIEEARRLYQEDASITGVVRQLGETGSPASWETIKEWVKDLVPERESIESRKIKARKLYQEGTTNLSKIVRSVGTDFNTVRRWLADLIPDINPKKVEARRLYLEEGIWSFREIARRVGAGRNTVKRWLADLPLQKRHLRRRNPDDLETLEKMAEARRLYDIHKSANKVAGLMNLDRNLIRKWVRDLMPKRPKHPKLDYALLREKAKELYARRKKIHEIAEILGVSPTTVHKWLRHLIPSIKTAEEWENLRQRAIELYKTHGSARKIARILEVSHATVNEWVSHLKPKKFSKANLLTQPKLFLRFCEYDKVLGLSGASLSGIGPIPQSD